MIIIIVVRMKTKVSLDDFFLALAVADLTVNITVTLDNYILYTSALQASTSTKHHTCRIITYLIIASERSSKFILAALSVQRGMAVAFPHKIQLFCHQKNTRWTILIVICAAVISSSHTLYFFGYDERIHQCTILGNSFYIINVFSLERGCINCLTILLVLISNAEMMYHIQKATEHQTSSREMASTEQRRRNKFNSVTVAAISVSVSYVVFLLPKTIVFAFYRYGIEAEDSQDDSRVLIIEGTKKLREFAMVLLVNVLSKANYCLNFYIYALPGRRYRREIAKLCRDIFQATKSV